MKVSVQVTLDLNYPLEEIGKERLKEHIRKAVLGWGGQFPLEDNLRDGIEDVQLSAIKRVVKKEDLHSLAGKARAKSLTAKERKEIASKAAKARWAKWRAEQELFQTSK